MSQSVRLSHAGGKGQRRKTVSDSTDTVEKARFLEGAVASGWVAQCAHVAPRARKLRARAAAKKKLTSLTPGTDSTVRAAWFPT